MRSPFLIVAIISLLGTGIGLYVFRPWVTATPPWEKTVSLWMFVAIALGCWTIWNPPEFPSGWSIAAITSAASFAAAFLGTWAFRVNSEWIEHEGFPLHLRPLAHTGLQSQRYRWINRECFFQGCALIWVHFLQSSAKLYWPLAAAGLGFLAFALCVQLISVRRALLRRVRVPKPLSLASCRWDVFFSYSSANANIVRRVAERLVAAGGRPWFAEHMIHFAGRDRFQNMIDAGIDGSAAGLLFTNHAYAASEHCERELVRLRPAQGLGKPALEIRMPNEPLLRIKHGMRLKGVPFVDFVSSDQVLVEIRRFLTDQQVILAAHDDRPATASPAIEPTKFVTQRGTLMLNPGSLHSRDKAAASLAPQVVLRSPVMQGRFGRCAAAFTLQLADSDQFQLESFDRRFRRKDDVSLDQRFRKLLDHPKLPAGVSDRWLLESGRDWMMLICAIKGVDCRGVHLRWQWGRPHLMLTYWQRDRWVRRYFLRIPDSGLMLDARFRLWGTYREYCRYAEQMDDIVGTCEWKPVPGAKMERTVHLEEPTCSSAEVTLDLQMSDANALLVKAFSIADMATTRAEMQHACALLKKAVAMEPRHPDAWNEYGFVLARLGDWQGSLMATSRACTLQPDNPKFQVAYASRKLKSLLETADEEAIDDEVRELRVLSDQLLGQFPHYPSIHALQADLVALQHGDRQSEWEAVLSRFAAAYYQRSRMQSGVPMSEARLASAMINATNQTLLCATLSCWRQRMTKTERLRQ